MTRYQRRRELVAVLGLYVLGYAFAAAPLLHAVVDHGLRGSAHASAWSTRQRPAGQSHHGASSHSHSLGKRSSERPAGDSGESHSHRSSGHRSENEGGSHSHRTSGHRSENEGSASHSHRTSEHRSENEGGSHSHRSSGHRSENEGASHPHRPSEQPPADEGGEHSHAPGSILHVDAVVAESPSVSAQPLAEPAAPVLRQGRARPRQGTSPRPRARPQAP